MRRLLSLRLMKHTILLTVFVVGLFSNLAFAEPLKVSTLNIRWYGLGGTREGGADRETRDRTLKKFFDENLADSDVISFQEIVDVRRLKANVVGRGHKCASYAHENERHQHVVICYRSDFALSRENGARGVALDEVALGEFRPAVVGLLKDEKGEPLAHLIAVHLKSAPQHSRTRLKQTAILADYIKSFDDGVPVIVLGDFNTHVTERGRDEDAMAEMLGSVDLVQIHNPFQYTYRTRRYTGRFDHIFASADVARFATATVIGPCNGDSPELTDRFYRTVSDHCAVSAVLEMP